VSVSELAGILDDVTLLDVRWRLGGPPGHTEFLRGHVPGASYVDLETDLADPPGQGGRHPLPEPGRFAAAMRRCGVSSGRPVVVYDAVAGTSAARCWWLLRHYGHADVRVLDGGFPAWEAHGLPVENGKGSPGDGDFAGTPGQTPVIDADQALQVAEEGALVDARAPERYRGDVEPVDPVAGHIPGAVNVPTAANLSGGLLRSADELRGVYTAAGVDPARPVGVYCGSGVTAAHDVLALEVAGIRAALYPGSWSGWITDPTRPVARGT
jgi:thiosulfate/3-mercaptopyruvate sulfurtransferase